MSRVVGYVRVSTVEQERSGLGMESQRQAIENECRYRQWDLVDVHEDALSGKSLNRPGIARALAAVESDAADVLMVAKLDRLSRSLKDFATLMERAHSNGWTLMALDLGFDLSTPAGELIAGFMAGMAQWERKIIGQRTKDGLAVKKAQGVKLGRTERIEPAVRERILAARASGDSLSAIARALNADGVPTIRKNGKQWYPSTVRGVVLALPSLPAPQMSIWG